MRGPSFECRGIAPAPHLDDDRIVTALIRIVFVELGSQPSRFHADDGIEARIVLVVAAEHGDANHILLDLIAFSRQRALDHVAEEPAHPIGVGESTARDQAVELEANLVGGRLHCHGLHKSAGSQSASMNQIQARAGGAWPRVTLVTVTLTATH